MGARNRFAGRVVRWQRRHGRHDLPWQRSRDPYAIWVSEIMLQQTQVATVIPYFERFMARFPDVTRMAVAHPDEVMQLWSGLGYYSRARNLHRAARMIVSEHGAALPRSAVTLATLPGVGRSTAGAIAAAAFGERNAILDGNVKRVLCRYFGIHGDPRAASVERSLWSLAESLVPKRGVEAYTQGLMDLGATVCTRRGTRCDRCPLAADCIAYRDGRVDALPTPRARKVLPQRTTVMLAVCHRGEVLLEKRPPAGIWGGMWSLPEIAKAAEAEAHCRRCLGVERMRVMSLPPIAHGFTHFKLSILPLRIDVGARNLRAGEPGRQWLALEDARGAAIPVPVRRILEAL